MRNFDISQGVAHMTYFFFQIFVTLHKFEISALSHMEIYADLQIFDNFFVRFLIKNMSCARPLKKET